MLKHPYYPNTCTFITLARSGNTPTVHSRFVIPALLYYSLKRCNTCNLVIHAIKHL